MHFYFSYVIKKLHIWFLEQMETSKEEKSSPIIFGDESLSDVTLVVDQQEVKVHKMV